MAGADLAGALPLRLAVPRCIEGPANFEPLSLEAPPLGRRAGCDFDAHSMKADQKMLQ